MQPEGSLPSSQNPPLLFTLSQRNAVHSHHISLKSILILSSLLLQGFPKCLFLSWFPSENLCVPLLSSIRSTFPAHLIFSILVRSTNHEALRHSVSSSPWSPRLFYAQYLGQHTTLEHPSAYVLLSVGQTAFHTHAEDRPLTTANNNIC